MRTALVKSDNTAAAQALMQYVGVERSVDFLLREGVSQSRVNATPFGVALGSSGISAIEMSVAFGVLGNGGIYQEPLTFIGIMDRNDKVLYDSHANQARRQVFKPSTAWLTVDIMKDAVSNGTGKSALIKGQTVAGKTGTNSDQKGVFFSGLTGWYAASVWIGHDNYKALSSKTTGGNSAARLWNDMMSAIHQQEGLSNRDILEGNPADYGLVRVTTCAVSGQLATDACRNDALGYGVATDYWAGESAPRDYCQMHQDVTICRDSNMLAGQYCPPASLISKAIVILPQGHPLQRFVGTQYESVLTDYLGPYATLLFSGDPN
jgi:penicillin-binding protein 1A